MIAKFFVANTCALTSRAIKRIRTFVLTEKSRVATRTGPKYLQIRININIISKFKHRLNVTKRHKSLL